MEIVLPAQTQSLFWLLIKDKPSTRKLLQRKAMALASYNCVVLCQIKITKWKLPIYFYTVTLLLIVGRSQVSSSAQMHLISRPWMSSDSKAAQPLHKVLIIMSWAIWTVRNEWIFKGEQPSPLKCKRIFLLTFSQHHKEPAKERCAMHCKGN